MRKKILIGSIIAVAILIGASFTSVVGELEEENTICRVSPLFQVRTKNAINKNQVRLIGDYLGKDKGLTIQVPSIEDRSIFTKEIIDGINKLDKDDFNQLLRAIVYHSKDEMRITIDGVTELITMLHLIVRTNIRGIKGYK
ncbi:MAG: hypothetical protein ACOC80_05680, partial [Petrotogales bacterium]